MKLEKSAAAALTALCCSLYWSEIPAQQYPSKPARIIVPFGAGGPADIYARYLAQRLQEPLGQSFVIDTAPARAPSSAPIWWRNRRPMAIRSC